MCELPLVSGKLLNLKGIPLILISVHSHFYKVVMSFSLLNKNYFNIVSAVFILWSEINCNPLIDYYSLDYQMVHLLLFWVTKLHNIVCIMHFLPLGQTSLADRVLLSKCRLSVRPHFDVISWEENELGSSNISQRSCLYIVYIYHWPYLFPGSQLHISMWLLKNCVLYFYIQSILFI
jgi:hypothetical protein